MDEVEAEIKARNIAGNKCYQALGYLLKKRHITQQLRVGLYKSVRPTVIYHAESWFLTKKMERALITWVTKILRKIYGPTTKWLLENTVNQEIYNKFKPQDTVTRNKYVDWNGLEIL